MKVFISIFIILAAVNSGATPSLAANLDKLNYQRAFQLVDTGHVAEVAAFQGRDPILNKVLRSLTLADPTGPASFDELNEFMAQNPDWPNIKRIQAAAEQKIPASLNPADIILWFGAHPPVSLPGFYRYIDALNVSGRTEESVGLIRTRWIDGDFMPDELAAFHSTFQTYLRENENTARVDRLLWKGDSTNARTMFSYLDAGQRGLAEARLALAARSTNAENLVDRVPEELRSDPGLIYDVLRWRVRNNQDDVALALLRHPPDPLLNTEAWWEQRQTMVHRLIYKKDYDGAYQLAVNHGHLEGKQLAEADFLCGWLALRFLNEADEAVQHFEGLVNNTFTPISRARANYWLGRAYEQQGNKEKAVQAYQTAASISVAYYGQMATATLNPQAMISVNPSPEIPVNIRNEFFNSEIVTALLRLNEIGEEERARIYFQSIADKAQTPADFSLLSELAYKIDRPYLAIDVGKAASKLNIQMTELGYPLLKHRPSSPPEPALSLALIRQESQFNPNIRSPVGAIGLMQLMPSTASHEAKKVGLHFKQGLLTNPEVNVRLGTHFIEKQIDSFDGSYVLALAGYNAGPTRVREWMSQIGDPRQPNVDVVDWVEQIPIYETRNYVQRILEALQIYRARLAGGEAPLEILKDLKR